MNKSIDVLKKIYKPYRYTKKGNTTIIYSTSGDFVIKEENKNIKELYSYLKSRNFDNFPNILDDSRKNINVYEYLNDTSYPKEQRANDLINLVTKLHYKTSFFKDVTEDKYKEIYDSILSNIRYLNERYDLYFDSFFKEVYNSPSHYLFQRNYTKLKNNLKFCENELNNWYYIVKSKKNVRVAVIHNNLSLSHFIKSDKDYLISWNNSCIDSPIIDIVKFYKKEYFDINFDNLLKTYLNNFKLNNDEKKLLFVLLTLPDEIIFDKDEFKSCLNTEKD